MIHRMGFSLPCKARKTLWFRACLPSGLISCYRHTASESAVSWFPEQPMLLQTSVLNFRKSFFFCCLLSELKYIRWFLFFLYRVVSAFSKWINHSGNCCSSCHCTFIAALEIMFCEFIFPLRLWVLEGRNRVLFICVSPTSGPRPYHQY